MSINNNISQFIASLNLLPQQIEDGANEGLDLAAEDGKANKERAWREGTYARAIPIGKNGKPKWERTGNAVGDVTIEVGNMERSVLNRGASEAYEESLANLPTGPDGINRTNNAAQTARDRTEPRAAAIIQQAIANRVNR